MSISIPRIFLLAIFIGLSGCYYEHPRESDKIKDITQELNVCAQGIVNLAKDCGIDRINPSDLPKALSVNPGWSGWNGPYIWGIVFPTDPWGTPVRYVRFGKKLIITSAGSDGKFGTKDDINVEVDLSKLN